MKLVSSLSIAATALAVGGVAVGTIVAAQDDAAMPAGAAPTAVAASPRVRTVVETQTVHRVRHVRAARRAPAWSPSGTAAAVAAQPAPLQTQTRGPAVDDARTDDHGRSDERVHGGDREEPGDDHRGGEIDD